ncbi:hypothetical protein [Viscerimonas tarda]
MRLNIFFAHAFSFILQPLLMPLYSIGLLFAYTNFHDIYMGQMLRFLIPVFIFSYFMPVLFIIILNNLKLIKGYALTERRDRVLPYLMTCFSNLILVYYFYQSSHPPVWFLGLLSIPVIIIIFAFIINLFWGISPHMLGIGGLIGGIMSVCFNVKGLNPFILFIVLFILAGCLAVSRLELKRDTSAQLYAGFICGLCLAYFCVWAGACYTHSAYNL